MWNYLPWFGSLLEVFIWILFALGSLLNIFRPIQEIAEYFLSLGFRLWKNEENSFFWKWRASKQERDRHDATPECSVYTCGTIRGLLRLMSLSFSLRPVLHNYSFSIPNENVHFQSQWTPFESKSKTSAEKKVKFRDSIPIILVHGMLGFGMRSSIDSLLPEGKNSRLLFPSTLIE